MHLIVAHAGMPPGALNQSPFEAHRPTEGVAGHAGLTDWATVAPLLARIASTWTIAEDLKAPASSYSPPHEVTWAKAVGACTKDGLVPWAFWLANQDGLALNDPCALLSFTHWRVTPNGLLGEHPDALGLNEQELCALAQAVEPWIRESGFFVHQGRQGRLYLSHPDMASLRTASLDRLVGQPMHAWPCEGSLAKAWHQLQNELQMVLHDLELNDDRAVTCRLVVNSVVLSGSGPRFDLPVAGRVQLDETLRHAQPDSKEWSTAWQHLEQRHMPHLLRESQVGSTEPVAITLAGRCRAVTLVPPSTQAAQTRPGWFQRWFRPRAAASNTPVTSAVKLRELLQRLEQEDATIASP